MTSDIIQLGFGPPADRGPPASCVPIAIERAISQIELNEPVRVDDDGYPTRVWLSKPEGLIAQSVRRTVYNWRHRDYTVRAAQNGTIEVWVGHGWPRVISSLFVVVFRFSSAGRMNVQIEAGSEDALLDLWRSQYAPERSGCCQVHTDCREHWELGLACARRER